MYQSRNSRRLLAIIWQFVCLLSGWTFIAVLGDLQWRINWIIATTVVLLAFGLIVLAIEGSYRITGHY